MSRYSGLYGYSRYRTAWNRTFSSPVRFMSSDAFWKMMPTSRRTALASRTTSCPAIFTLPDVRPRVVVRMEIVVVLPAPFGPSSAKNWPCSTSKVTPSTAFTVPFRYRFTRSRTSIAGAISGYCAYRSDCAVALDRGEERPAVGDRADHRQRQDPAKDVEAASDSGDEADRRQ